MDVVPSTKILKSSTTILTVTLTNPTTTKTSKRLTKVTTKKTKKNSNMMISSDLITISEVILTRMKYNYPLQLLENNKISNLLVLTT